MYTYGWTVLGCGILTRQQPIVKRIKKEIYILVENKNSGCVSNEKKVNLNWGYREKTNA